MTMNSYPDTQTAFRRRLSLAKERAGLTATQLYQMTGVTKQAISKYENGRLQNPTLKTAAVLADALGVTVDFLAGLEDDLSVDPISIAGEANGRLSGRNRAVALALIDMLEDRQYPSDYELIRDFVGLLEDLDEQKRADSDIS